MTLYPVSTVRIVLSDCHNSFRYSLKKSIRARTERLRDLEALEAVAVFGLVPHHVHDSVHELGAVGVVALLA